LLLEAFEWHVPDDKNHWYRLQQALPGLKDIGIDNIWLPPGCKGMDASGSGYDIYDLYDLGEFNQKGTRPTKWGSREDLEELVAEAQSLGVGIYWDAVLNHKAGADYPERFQAVKVDPNRKILLLFLDIVCELIWSLAEQNGLAKSLSPLKSADGLVLISADVATRIAP
jgi:alpha-amylase